MFLISTDSNVQRKQLKKNDKATFLTFLMRPLSISVCVVFVGASFYFYKIEDIMIDKSH